MGSRCFARQEHEAPGPTGQVVVVDPSAARNHGSAQSGVMVTGRGGVRVGAFDDLLSLDVPWSRSNSTK